MLESRNQITRRFPEAFTAKAKAKRKVKCRVKSPRRNKGPLRLPISPWFLIPTSRLIWIARSPAKAICRRWRVYTNDIRPPRIFTFASNLLPHSSMVAGAVLLSFLDGYEKGLLRFSSRAETSMKAV